MVESSREEALNAVEFHNRPGARKPLESFLIHMHIAWTHLLQAEFERDSVSYYYRDRRTPSRYLKVDGERKVWELDRCVQERWKDPRDPVRNNLQLTIKLRNRIEHRYQAGLMVAAAGFAQALVINFEEELVTQFGPAYSIADQVHLPIALGTFSREGVVRLIAAQQGLPRKLQDFFVEYRSGLDSDVVNDRRFELRVDIVRKRAPRTDADLAVSFVQEEDLLPQERAAYAALEKTGRIILREKERPVSNLGRLRPKGVCEEVEGQIPFRFRHSAEFPVAWKHFRVRPAASARGKARRKTDERYCSYDEAHDDYVYTAAFVALLARECGTPEGFRNVIGRDPTPQSASDSHRSDDEVSRASGLATRATAHDDSEGTR
ncbi:MAG: DUF3644 domain-containing protein [Actinobacteria bacterium]|nr:DUF3644 domain-containing protein [Actinomycetota bacterium]MCL5736282.1 DUF3644 domain-containing protein [Actinomycetota bacterium]